MKKRCELQYLDDVTYRWRRSKYDGNNKSMKDKVGSAMMWNRMGFKYRVVQKLGRKVIKVVYQKGDKQ